MKYIQKDMLQAMNELSAEAIGFTANSCKTKDNKLVMGAGAAKTVRDRYPGVDTRLGELIQNELYYTQPVKWGDIYIVAIQTKKHYREHKNNCDLIPLITRSMESLQELLNKRPNRIMVMNMPGVGFCGYTFDEIAPIIEETVGNCKNLYICHKGEYNAATIT